MRHLIALICLLVAACGFAQTLDVKRSDSGSTAQTSKSTVTIYKWMKQNGVLTQSVKTMPAETAEDMRAVYSQRGFRTINLSQVPADRLAALAKAELTASQLKNREGIAAEFPPNAYYLADENELSAFTSHTTRITRGEYDPDPAVWNGTGKVLVPHTTPLLGWMVFKRRNGTEYYRFGFVTNNEPVVGLSRRDPASNTDVPLEYVEVYNHPGQLSEAEDALVFTSATNALRCKNHFPTVALARVGLKLPKPIVTTQRGRVDLVERTLFTTTTITTEKVITVTMPSQPDLGKGIFIAFNGHAHVNDTQQIRNEIISLDMLFLAGACKALPKTVCDDVIIDWDDLPGDTGDTGPNPWLGGDVEWGPPPPGQLLASIWEPAAAHRATLLSLNPMAAAPRPAWFGSGRDYAYMA